MIRKIIKENGSEDEYSKDGERIKKSSSFRLDVRDYNMVQTYFWFYDLHGRLKQEDRPPADYHGRPRAYVKEDIEEDRDRNLVTSHLRFYLGKKLLAYTTSANPEFEIRFLGEGYEDAGSRFKIRQMVKFLLDGGWTYYKIPLDEPKYRRKPLKIKSKPTRIIKKRDKVVSKKIVNKKRKK